MTAAGPVAYLRRVCAKSMEAPAVAAAAAAAAAAVVVVKKME